MKLSSIPQQFSFLKSVQNRNHIIDRIAFGMALTIGLLMVSLQMQANTIHITPVSATSPITYSDTDAYHASYTIDGNLATYWQAASWDPQLRWIKFDLGSVYSVLGISETTGSFPANAYMLSASGDDINYTIVATGSLTSYMADQYFAAAVNARYLLLDIIPDGNRGSGELVEFQAIVDNTVSPVPDAGSTFVFLGIAFVGFFVLKR